MKKREEVLYICMFNNNNLLTIFYFQINKLQVPSFTTHTCKVRKILQCIINKKSI